MPRVVRFLTFGICVLFAANLHALPLEDVIARAKPAVVHLSVRNSRGDTVGSGSGFVISRDGKVATNFHVVEGAQALEAVFDDGKKHPIVGAWAFDADADIAVLQLPKGEYPSLPLATVPARQGAPVLVIGSPLGLSGTVSTGIVSAVRDEGATHRNVTHPQWNLQVTAPISPGSSGSPILNQDAEVVGVAVGLLLNGQALNFGVPVRALRVVLDRSPQELRPIRGVGTRSVLENILISIGGLGAVALVVWTVLFVGRKKQERRENRGRALLSSILKE